LTEKCSGKYLKKLVGRTEMEDALKKLDKLTNEEARMATAQTLKATHAVDDRVRGVEDKVHDVENRVAGVDDRVAGVDDKVAVIIDGAQSSSISHQENIFNSDVPRGKRGKSGHTANSKQHGSSETFVIHLHAFWVCRLNHPHRESITTGPPQMALSTGSVYKPQHCVWCSPQENSRVVFPG
jgi:hypothetical protein